MTENDSTRSLAQILKSIDQTMGELVQTLKDLQELDRAYKAQQTKNLSKELKTANFFYKRERNNNEKDAD